MKLSPFQFGTTVSTRSFTNREKEIQKLTANLLQGINTTLISPRRWGKTSLVEKVIFEISKREKKTKTVLIDLFTTHTEETFLEIFTREVIKASTPKWEEWMKMGGNFFKRLVPRLSVGVDPNTDFKVSFDWKELKLHSDEVLNLPEKIAKSRGIRIIICLDEFQNIVTYPDYPAFEKKMRAVWQRQKLVTYCIFGSKSQMMRDIFNDSSKPFYRFGDIMSLPKIETESWVKFIRQSFRDSGKQIDKEIALLIPKLMQNHSWYVQQLSHYVWVRTIRKVTRQELEKAFNELIQANTPLYQNQLENISKTQMNLLKVVGSGKQRFTSKQVMDDYQLGTPRNVIKNKNALLRSDLLIEIEGKIFFGDPAFEFWFMYHFLNKPYPDFKI